MGRFFHPHHWNYYMRQFRHQLKFWHRLDFEWELETLCSWQRRWCKLITLGRFLVNLLCTVVCIKSHFNSPFPYARICHVQSGSVSIRLLYPEAPRQRPETEALKWWAAHLCMDTYFSHPIGDLCDELQQAEQKQMKKIVVNRLKKGSKSKEINFITNRVFRWVDICQHPDPDKSSAAMDRPARKNHTNHHRVESSNPSI